MTNIVCYGRYPHYNRWSGLPTDPMEQGSDRLMMYHLKKNARFRFEDGRVTMGSEFIIIIIITIIIIIIWSSQDNQ